ncbi:MAG: hypothetical protein JSS65_12070 [Armatimonadetes bacterium]|nr:hypothetical protein [Armatimonadota bacterium]
MKKKQSPVMLIVLGAVVLVGIALTNSTDIWAKIFTPPPKETKKDAPEQKVDTKAMVQAEINRHKKDEPENAEPGATGIPETPSILVAKFKRYDPVPNESSTNSQWYLNEHEQQKRKEELAKKRGY